MPDLEIIPVHRPGMVTSRSAEQVDDGVSLIADELNMLAQGKGLRNIHQVLAKELMNMAQHATTISPVGDTMDDNVARLGAMKEIRLILDKRPKSNTINVAVFPTSQGI